jgi:hypothetical protein
VKIDVIHPSQFAKTGLHNLEKLSLAEKLETYSRKHSIQK